MKRVKLQALYLGAMLVVGITLLVIGYMGDINSMMAGMGTAMTVVCAINLLRLRGIAKDPKRLREMELVQHEERLIFISDKASCFFSLSNSLLFWLKLNLYSFPFSLLYCFLFFYAPKLQ